MGRNWRRDLADLYAAPVAFARAAPLVFLLPAIPELAQHAVEAQLGMYASLAAFRAHAASGARLGIGFVKLVALLLPGWWMPRFMAWGDARRAARPETPALALWLPVLAVSAGLQALKLFAPPLHRLLGLADRGPGPLLDAGAALSLGVLGVYLTAWTVAAPLGNRRVGPLRSLALMPGAFWRTVGYTLAAFAPGMAAHYALGIGAIGRPMVLAAAMLVVDGLVVALLANATAAAAFLAARAALERRGEPLGPDAPAVGPDMAGPAVPAGA